MHRYGLMQSTVLHLACHQSYAEHDNIIFYATGLFIFNWNFRTLLCASNIISHVYLNI